MVEQQVTSQFIRQTKTTNGQNLLMTRLTPPPQRAHLLARNRVDGLLGEAMEFPLTLVIAPAGSGKTTALAGFAMRTHYPVAWCRMSDEDDPLSLLCHLVAAFRVAGILREDRVCSRIVYGEKESEDAHTVALSPHDSLDRLVNELVAGLHNDTFLFLDDYHFVDQQPILRDLIERFIAIQPKRLHLLLSTRYHPNIALLPTRRARGEVYQLGQHEFAFTVEEAQALFAFYEQPLPPDSIRLTHLCRGWPLALQLLAGRHATHQADDAKVDQQGAETQTEHAGGKVFEQLSSYFDTLQPLLDEYLTQQVFDVQPLEMQTFLLYTAGLRWFDKDVCAALPFLREVAPFQDALERRCLFLEPLETGKFGYQPLFKSFLHRLMKERLSNWRDLHVQAAEYYRALGDQEGVVYHLLEVGQVEQAVELLEHVAHEWIRQGRSKALLTWLDHLPEPYQRRTTLLEVRASAYRQCGRFDHALQSYKQAEQIFHEQGNAEGQSRTLRGRAEVYLDTVQPSLAATLLKQALKLLPTDKRIERAEILLLQAENWANRGRADVALLLETSAQRLLQAEQSVAAMGEQASSNEEQMPTDALVPAHSLTSRLLLRSGRLNESRRLLEAELGLEHHDSLAQRPPILAHREPLLLLALLYVLLGNGARALAMALRGLLEAMHSGSQFTEAIAHMRVGHAYQTVTPLDASSAKKHYEQAIELVDAFGVTRTKVEGYMGLALLHGHAGNLTEAELIAQEGLRIAEDSGDEWIAALIWLGLGGAAVAAGDARAVEWLDLAHQRFTHGGETYGRAVVALWRGLWYLREGKEKDVKAHVAELLELMHTYEYEGLLTAPTLFGPRDMAMLIPLLLRGRGTKEYAAFAQQLLRQSFPTIAADESVEDYHPGYTLRIQMLGSFRVWRGQSEIQAREWQREKARQLLQLLLTYRGQWIQREQICSWLWPDSDLDAAERQFKVTLNALNTALEPFRPPRTTPFFVRRQGLAYSFAPSYGCWIDVDEFELRTTNVPQSDPDFVLRNAQVAAQLYKGDYLAEALYDPWTLEERERLLARYLAMATALAEQLMAKGNFAQAIEMCEKVLQRDRCYEEAYQVLIRTHARGGSRSQALRSYMRCVQALQDDLGIDPLPETTALYEQIKQNEGV